MSAHAGVWCFDSTPVSATQLVALEVALRRWGSHVTTIPLPSGPVMLYSEPPSTPIHPTRQQSTMASASNLTPHDTHAAPPAPSGTTAEHIHTAFGQDHVATRRPFIALSGNAISLIGRLDNRDDLTIRNGLSSTDDHGDARLALTLYERLGMEAFASFIGDWSIVLWDRARDTLICASDHLGLRPLYLYLGRRRFTWSSDLGELVRREDKYHDIDGDYVRSYVNGGQVPATPYRGIELLPAGHCAIVSRRAVVQLERHWRPSCSVVRYADHESYREHFRRIFSTAVRCRLRAPASVWAELSGGLDSSSIVCMTDVLNYHRSRDPVPTISRVSDEYPDYDERSFIGMVECARQTRGVHIRTEDACGQVDTEDGWVSPSRPYGDDIAVAEHVAKQGGRVLLSGQFGDQATANAPSIGAVLSDSLAERRYAELLSTVRGFSRQASTTCYAQIAEAVRYRRKVRRYHQREALTNWIAGGAQPPAVGWPFSLLADVLRAGSEGWYVGKAGYPAVHYTYPFADRRVVDFMASIPADVVARLGRPRALLRSALRGIVPDRILNRASKTLAISKALRIAPTIIRRLAYNPRHVSLLEGGFVEKAWWTSACASIARNPIGERNLAIRLVTAEHWLRVRGSGCTPTSPWALYLSSANPHSAGPAAWRAYTTPYCRKVRGLYEG